MAVFPSEFRTRAKQIAVHSPTDQQAQLRVVSPALVSALFNNLPDEVRDIDLDDITVPTDPATPDVAVLGDAEPPASGFAGRVIKVFSTVEGGVVQDPPTEKTIITAGVPAGGEVLVEYDDNGIATLTFAAADTVEKAAIAANLLPSNFKELMAEQVGM